MMTGRTNGIVRIVCVQTPIHRPSVYFIEFALPMVFENHASAHASMADDALSKTAHNTIIQHESLILAQDERWRRA